MDTIPNYIAYAAIILTADYLGFSVSCKYVAENTIKSKQMPEALWLGYFERAAADAKKQVLDAGFGEKADALAKNLIINGTFES